MILDQPAGKGIAHDTDAVGVSDEDGASRNPDSWSQWVRVISPLPFCEKKPPKTGSPEDLPRGQTAVTPVRTESPSIRVRWPTSTPVTLPMALNGPVVPSSMTPGSRAPLGLSAQNSGGEEQHERESHDGRLYRSAYALRWNGLYRTLRIWRPAV